MKQTTTLVRKLFEGRLRLETRNSNPTIYARTCLQGRVLNFRTGQTRLVQAEPLATDWYLSLIDRIRKGERLHTPLFADIAEKFIAHAERVKEVSEGQRRNYRHKWSRLQPFFRNVRVTDIDAAWLNRFRDARLDEAHERGTPLKPTTIRKDLVFIGLVLRYAKEYEKALTSLPEMPSFRGARWAIVSQGRPYFPPDEYKKLIRAAWLRTREAELNPRVRRQRTELYRMIHIMVGAALRVGEAQSLRWRDCTIGVLSDDKPFSVLHLSVLGKHSKGGNREHAYGTQLALAAYGRMEEGPPDEPVFKESHRDGFRQLLESVPGLRTDAEGRTRDLKSLRPTGMSQRLEATPNPDYRDIAKWARTSPGMIATFYDQTHPEQSVTRLMSRKRRRY